MARENQRRHCGSIVGFVRQAALGDPLLAYEERVERALQKILARQAWKPPQRQWLERIAAQVKHERVVNREDMSQEPFSAKGGFARANKAFDGMLEQILRELHDGIWEQANEAS